ncbi:hypothetical protein [Bradyrhizobium tropiciagri]|uniref:hypothetical protein n=1 Tax=Bradyrhizobium tropiciagri TaxID=312253 RepID=UPI00067B185B|nr:hypothetical protein [Bradyrhizobium tropiciagri]
MAAYRNVAVAQLAGDDLDPFLGVRILDPKQFCREQFAEAVMDFDDAVLRRRATVEASLIDPLLYGDMGDGFLLQVAFLGAAL